jgi:hypothetical protein
MQQQQQQQQKRSGFNHWVRLVMCRLHVCLPRIEVVLRDYKQHSVVKVLAWVSS